ncbi:hypothetical protein [Piscinibacter sakaiensis]|uniref:hypothetical protein n=1 Tax=Piscinibacter sakaiensis TaxID=1547922 RepID=UPI003AAD47CB
MDGGLVAEFYLKTFLNLLKIGFLIFFLFSILAPLLFYYALGSEYRAAGELVKYMAGGILAHFLVQPFVYVFIATNQVKIGFILQSLLAIVPSAVIVIGGVFFDFESTLIVWSAITTGIAGSVLFLGYRLSIRDDATRARPI